MRIALLGDIYLSNKWAGGSRADAGRGLFEHVRRRIGPETAMVANVEFAISDCENPREIRPYKWAVLCSSPAVAERLNPLSVAVVANNHAGDAGIKGLEETVRNLHRHGVRSVGYGKTLEHALEACIIEREGKKIALVALCCLTTNSESIAAHCGPGIPLLSVQYLRHGIIKARQQADAVIAFLHWGCEQTPYPVPDQIRLGRLAVDAGANAVVGCHAHIIQAYERYNGCWILHGIGNFYFDPLVAKYFENGRFIEDVHIDHEVENRESLIPVFELRGHSLEMIDLFATSWKGMQPPTVKDLPNLSVNLSKINAQLQSWIGHNQRELSSAAEPEFKCRLRNGSIIYYYSQLPIRTHWTLRNITKRGYRKARRIAASLQNKLQQSYPKR